MWRGLREAARVGVEIAVAMVVFCVAMAIAGGALVFLVGGVGVVFGWWSW